MNTNDFNIYETINKLMNELQNKGIPFEYKIDNDSIGGGYEDKGNLKDGSRHTIDIHIGNEEDFIQNGEVNQEKLMGIISTIYHEYRHLEQTEKYKYNPDFSKDSINIARMDAIQKNGLSNYYFENYRNDPKEVDATKYGFEEAIKYVKQEMPGIDAEKGIEEYVHSYMEKDKNDEYGFHMFDENKSDTIKEILDQLQERIDNPTRVDLSKVASGFIEDVQLKALLTDEFIETYEKCNSSEEKDSLIFEQVVKIHPEILDEYPVLQNEINKDDNKESMVINGQSVEVKKEKGSNFVKTTRSLNGVEINSDKEYKNGSYDKKSKIFVADKGIHVSKDFINYTTYKQQYDAKEDVYIDQSQSPLIDDNNNVIGEQETVERFDAKNGEINVNSFSSIQNENGFYELETQSTTIGDDFKLSSTLNIDNKLSGNKEKIQYTNENGKEAYIYMENGVIGQKITKTDRGTTIDIYKDGQPAETYEYDENGNALIQMQGLDKLPDDYVQNCFDVAIPEYILVVHEEPEEIYIIDEIEKSQETNIQEVSTQKLGKETLDVQTDVEKIDIIEQQLTQHINEQSQEIENNYQINQFGEIIRTSDSEKSFRDDITPQVEKNNFRESIKVHPKTETDIAVDKVLSDFEKGITDKEEIKKKYSHKVEKGDNDYIR